MSDEHGWTQKEFDDLKAAADYESDEPSMFTKTMPLEEYRAMQQRIRELETLLNKGANLINYSVSGMPVPILDWTRHIADVRVLLGDAYREYDARSK